VCASDDVILDIEHSGTLPAARESDVDVVALGPGPVEKVLNHFAPLMIAVFLEPRQVRTREDRDTIMVMARRGEAILRTEGAHIVEWLLI
jgi:hypothetical protein